LARNAPQLSCKLKQLARLKHPLPVFNERFIAKALTNADYSPKVGQY
jgi:hypothetical protein